MVAAKKDLNGSYQIRQPFRAEYNKTWLHRPCKSASCLAVS